MHAQQLRKFMWQKKKKIHPISVVRKDYVKNGCSCRRTGVAGAVPKVISTSSAGCIMSDEVNQPETKAGRGRTACPLYASSPPFSSTHTHHICTVPCVLLIICLNNSTPPLLHTPCLPPKKQQQQPDFSREPPQELSISMFLYSQKLFILSQPITPTLIFL